MTALAVQRARVEEPPRDQPRPARRIEIGGDEAAARLQIREDRHAGVDAIEVLEAERHAHLARDRDQVQHGVGRAAGGGHGGDGVLERVAGDDAATAGARRAARP